MLRHFKLSFINNYLVHRVRKLTNYQRNPILIKRNNDCSNKKLWNEEYCKNLRIQYFADRRKIVAYWLFGCSGMISVAVVLGGITRLTESGLSMVSWKFLGEKKPKTEIEWDREFQNYKQFPEFKMLNSSITLEEFKFIYLMEYSHRMWGRAIGLYFLAPCLYFLKRRFFTPKLEKYVLTIATLIGAQGLMGWYMVKSGLEDRFHDTNDVPRVSQYRLASHLSLAFLLHTLCLSSAFSYLLPAEKCKSFTSYSLKFRRIAFIAMGVIFLTAISGAFVAGLDAGLVYNSFPKMADNWIPDDIIAMKPIYKNLTENPVTVQFTHRLLGISTLSLISTLYILRKRAILPKRAYWCLNSIVLVACAQVILGISTLLNHVPVSLAAAHQSGSLLLLSLVVWLNHEIKLIKYLPK